MSYPTDKPSGIYALRDYNFASNDDSKIPMDETFFKKGYKNASENEVDSVPDAHEQNWLFDILHRNLKYTMEVAEENKDVLERKVASAGSIGQVKIGSGLNVDYDGTISVIDTVAEKAKIITYELPIGAIMLWAGSTIPSFFIEVKGQVLSKTNYPELYTYVVNNGLIGDGKMFNYSSIADSFEMTECRDYFLKVLKNGDTAGVIQPEGLPNITGVVGSTDSDSTASSGAFYRSGKSGSVNKTDGVTLSDVSFDASRSNSIYGASTHVTPRNVGFKLIMKALPTPASNQVPTGTILSYSGKDLPDGYLRPNGAEVSRTDFAELYAWALKNGLIKEQSSIPSTPHCYYGSGDGSTTFTLPDLMGVFPRYVDTTTDKTRGGADLGVYQKDGLPNITGTVSAGHYSTAKIKYDGAFYRISQSKPGDDGSYSESTNMIYGFDASRVNTIYGNSQYVQPKSVSMMPILKY